MRYIIAGFLFTYSFCTHAQKINPDILKKPWPASWIAVPGEPANSYGVFLFRKKIELTARPTSFMIHVSADNRYKLYVNEKLVSLGPARGDIGHWNFESVDIAPWLLAGSNIIAAKVWNEAEWRPEGQISLRTGFIVQGNGNNEQVLNTSEDWKCVRDSSYQPIKVNLNTYYVAGPGELIDMNIHIRDWEKFSYNDSSWKIAKLIFKGTPKTVMGSYGTINEWMLVPSAIPQMELTDQRLARSRKSEGIVLPASFPSNKSTVTIPSNTSTSILLDQSFLTNAYPTLIFSGGKQATISLGYAEGLFTNYPGKGNRNEVEGKIMMGRKDSIISDGSKNQQFTSLSYRTYRYIQVDIATKQEPLTLEDIFGTFTGYPFQFNAKLESQDSTLNKIIEIGWRTARLCAMETYMDCPYYEQLQYIGDSRIQGLISIYNSGDDRLLRNALNQMDQSRQPEGVTLSRHPSFTPQYIPTFSLWYIGMLHDYWMYGRDSNFVKDKLPGEREVLNYFRKYQTADGSLKDVPYWMFTDWVETSGWSDGIAPVGKDGSSALLDLQLLWAYQVAADMENKIGMTQYGNIYLKRAAQLKSTIRNKYWDSNKKLFADRPEKDLYSQHANILAILTGIVSSEEMKYIGKQLLLDTSLAPASIYFKYYLHQSLIKAGMGNDYVDWLGNWRENIQMGMTTWAETDVNTTRSDCHAWGASPNIEFFRTVLGIDSDAPGFAKLKIEPHLGEISSIGGEVPHPNGKVSVHYTRKQGKWSMNINLPRKTSGTFIWNNKSYPLKEGENNLQL